VIDGSRSMAKSRQDGCYSRIRPGWSALRWSPLCLAMALAGCHETGPSSGDVLITASTKALRYSDIATVSATITGSGIPRPLVMPLGAKDNNVWKANVAGIPAGTERGISVLASDQSGVGLFFGEATNVAIRPGVTTPISITLFEMSPAPWFANNAPVIDVVTASAAVVAPGGRVNLGVQAHDADPSDVLTYGWSTACGTLSGADTATPVWTAPDGAAVCQVELTVEDGRGAGVHSSVSLVVDSIARGGAAVSVSPDLSPLIKSMSITPTPVVVGQPVTLNLDAVDPDGQVLTFKWTSDCAGAFADATQQNAGFTLSAIPASGHCQFQVEVTDSLGAHTVGMLNQATGSVEVDRAPVIEAATQSHDELDPKQSAVLAVKASDPDGKDITFSWTADQGTVVQMNADVHSVSLRFTAPEVLPAGAMHVEVTVKDPGGQSAKVTFIFNRVNHAPAISSTTISPSPLVTGAATHLRVVAMDADADALTYAWTTTCAGTFDDAGSDHPTFTLTTFPTGYYCSFEVLVTDGHGGQAVGAVVGIADHLPVVGAPTIAPAEIIVGESIKLTVTATDPDGDALSYSWSRSCEGTFDDRTAQNPTFTLSAMPSTGHCSFTVNVTDMRGGQSMATVEGMAGNAPDITDMQATLLPLLVGQATQLSVTAADADNDPLTYAWASDCDGNLSGGTSATPIFTLATVPAGHLCTFQVVASDGRGGASLGKFSVQAGAVVLNLAPTIGTSSQGWSVVSPKDVVLLSVLASDPEGQPVTYTWTATDGTLSTPVTSADTSVSSASWTAPSVLSGQAMHVTVVVSDPAGLSTSVTFDFTAGPT